MKAKWSGLVDDLRGHVDKRHYARHIPGNWEWAAVCEKPELSKETKKKKASLPHVKEFSHLIATCKEILHTPLVFLPYSQVSLIATCKEILHTPEKRAAWQAKYDEAVRKARRHNKPIQGRLCDYVRHEVSVALKKGESIEP